MRQGKGSFADVAIRYAEQVIAGDIVACWQIKSSCQRFLDDIKGDTWTLNAAKVQRVCQFAETFPYLEGPLAAKRLKLRLEPWQIWILASLFGIVDGDGFRKHREAFIEIPRKNGKSTFAAVIALYMLVADYEPSVSRLNASCSTKTRRAASIKLTKTAPRAASDTMTSRLPN
ncbi:MULTISPECIES: terminase large subunit domain-containing protein [unclassified Sphingomonas]|uniref:terminase large subunit domain-containing protein n=1 Tax=Sphingomonas sp. PvP015 TaxID=3156388 RepID=UPI003399353A